MSPKEAVMKKAEEEEEEEHKEQGWLFETERLGLEYMSEDKEEHVRANHEIWSDEARWDWMGKSPTQTIQESRDFLISILNRENPEIDKLAVSVKSDGSQKGKMIGFVGTNRWSKEGLGMEVGYAFVRSAWGKGYATEALQGFLEWFWRLDERKKISQLIAKSTTENTASHKVLLKSGGIPGPFLEKGLVKSVKREDGEVVEEKIDALCWIFARPGEKAEVELT